MLKREIWDKFTECTFSKFWNLPRFTREISQNERGKFSPNFTNNHHGAENPVIWLVEQSAIKLFILIYYYGKPNFEAQRNFNVALHW